MMLLKNPTIYESISKYTDVDFNYFSVENSRGDSLIYNVVSRGQIVLGSSVG